MKLDDLMAFVDARVVSDATQGVQSESRRERVESRYVQWLEAQCESLERTVASHADELATSRRMMNDWASRYETLASEKAEVTARLDARIAALEQAPPAPSPQIAPSPVMEDERLSLLAERMAAMEAARVADQKIVSMPIREDPDEFDIDVRRRADGRLQTLNFAVFGKTAEVVRDGADNILGLRVRTTEQH